MIKLITLSWDAFTGQRLLAALMAGMSHKLGLWDLHSGIFSKFISGKGRLKTKRDFFFLPTNQKNLIKNHAAKNSYTAKKNAQQEIKRVQAITK